MSSIKIMFPTCGVGGSHSWGMFSYFSKSTQKTTMFRKAHIIAKFSTTDSTSSAKAVEGEKSQVWIKVPYGEQ
jgi:hypothetical protein